MDNQKILQRVIELFSTMSDADEINETSELMEDLDISSMDILFLISCMEEEFQIKIGEKDIRRMVTIGDVADVVSSLIG